jgi:dihydrodipicolinate synthase/N-acetylneuraminate lyase
MKFEPGSLLQYETRRKPGRKISGISALLLPYDALGKIDEAGFRSHARRTLAAGLRLAVNMDTGYIDLLTPDEKQLVLRWTRELVPAGEWFAAGAAPASGKLEARAAYAAECRRIAEAGGVPVIFPSPAMAVLGEDGLTALFEEIASAVPRFIAFELGSMFNPNGRLFSESVLQRLMELPQCIGLKHSSLDRDLELRRIEVRDRVRPDFVIYTGNDLAADMVEYGSDYLLGLSTFCPELFAARDRAWALQDSAYYPCRDLIQYVGWIGFRAPVPAYKHSAAIFLQATGWLGSSLPHPRAARREAWDHKALAEAAGRVMAFLPEAGCKDPCQPANPAPPARGAGFPAG